jgi:hypothetical protein
VAKVNQAHLFTVILIFDLYVLSVERLKPLMAKPRNDSMQVLGGGLDVSHLN